MGRRFKFADPGFIAGLGAGIVTAGLILRLEPEDYNGVTWTSQVGAFIFAAGAAPAGAGSIAGVDFGTPPNSYLISNNTCPILTDLTWNVWANINTAAGEHFIFGQDTGCFGGSSNCGLTEDGTAAHVQAYMQPSPASLQIALPTAAYHMLSFTVAASGDSHFYVDGVDGANVATMLGLTSACKWVIAANTGAGPGRFHSKFVGQILAYNRALTAAEVLQNYTAMKPNYP